ncbi:MAG: putative inorganic carbon transporter subunit DabA, partial [Phycisphaerales bacterium]
LQYFASTLDNARLGAGDKLLHNRIGSVGVVLGNGGDLRPGLPLQSVRGEDGRCVHDPLRLQAVIEAPTAKIDEVLATCPHTRDLVDGGWLRLFALDPAGDVLRRSVPGEGWEEFPTDAGILSACPAPTR